MVYNFTIHAPYHYHLGLLIIQYATHLALISMSLYVPFGFVKLYYIMLPEYH